MKIKRVHKNCGGIVKDKKCLKCGKKWNSFKDFFDVGIEGVEDKLDEREYRKRIRDGTDLTK